jgi:cobalt-zinc-cadmium efflux system protein
MGHDHDHGVADDADRRYLTAVLVLLGLYLAGEVVVSFASGSLALLSDAGHMLSDLASVAAALWVLSLSSRPPSGRWTFGWKRAEILSAAGNGVTLLVIAGIVAVESIRRLVQPTPVQGGPVLLVAAIGVLVNLLAVRLLARANRRSLNIAGAYQHLLTDLFGLVATLAAAVVILLTGWTRADPIASLVVVVLMVKASWELLHDSGQILLELAPAGVDLAAVRAHLLDVEHVRDVHDLHIWSLTPGMPTLSVHVVVDDSCFQDGHAPQLLDQLQHCLAGHFDVEHSTFQLETAGHGAHESGAHA